MQEPINLNTHITINGGVVITIKGRVSKIKDILPYMDYQLIELKKFMSDKE